MDNSVLRKRLNTFKSSEGRLQSVSDEVIISVLKAWENWPGATADLYRELDLTKMQMVSLLKKAKKLVKAGVVTESEFQEVSELRSPATGNRSDCFVIEISWDNNRLIRFSQVDELIDFLKKVV